MPHTFTQLHFHVVFSTKYREPVLVDEIRDQVWSYMGGIVRGEGGSSLRIGGMPDHIHMLISLRQTKSLADVVRNIKASSSGWMAKTFPSQPIRWQTGYAAFSVSHSTLDDVSNYIAHQAIHYQKRSYQDELRLMLKLHGLEPDEEHMWG